MTALPEILQVPNLPQKKVSVAVSAVPIEGVNCICPPEIPCLPASMQRHADLQICHLGGKYILAAPEVFPFYEKQLSPFGFSVLCGETHIQSTYPGDAAYTVARIGNAAIHNPEITDPVALRFFKKHDISFIPVRQGYAKCAIVPVDETSFITADHGIARAARKAGFSVLEILPGGVKLPGFLYGFLGGAAGKTAPDTLFCTGKISTHPSYSKIEKFLHERGIKIEEGSIPISIDIGSVLPLLER